MNYDRYLTLEWSNNNGEIETNTKNSWGRRSWTSIHVCADCGAVVMDTDKHDEFHDGLVGEK